MLHRDIAGRDGPILLGRNLPIEALQLAARRAAAGRGGVVIVSGEACTGKTALLRAFADDAADSHQVFWGGGEAPLAPRPLGSLTDIASTLDRKVAALIEAGAARSRLFPALLGALQDMGATAILIVEDVHRADRATLDLIIYLGRRMMLLRALLVLSLRHDEVAPGDPLRQVLDGLPAGISVRIDLNPVRAPRPELMSSRETPAVSHAR
jgi:predicted ATPase